MPLSPNRKLIQISDKAYEHILKIKKARKRLGLSSSITGYASDLFLSQPIPLVNGNGKAHIVGQDEPIQVKVKAAEIALTIEGEVKQ
jgi:hypothetical protein